ncbi:MAG: HAD-IIB family hydrolase [Chloroflexales bacterium]|nr:HAD-IIB family hydrolase [Chloroflexales bacterium]
MRYLVLATDYDGTLARDGRLDEPTISALERLRASGRQIFLVTGRELDDLRRVCPRLDLFEQVVAENGALRYTPANNWEQVLGEAPPETFVAALRARGVAPLSVGRSIVATWTPHATTTLEVIHSLGLELQVIFNKDAVMVLPAGVNKASGLQAALAAAKLSPHNVVGIGDAENDHAFLSLCECGVAVANALPMLKERADWVTRAERGAGVAELIDALLASDLAEHDARLQRYWLLIGTGPADAERRLSPYATNLLISGSSGSGKSTLATALLDQLVGQEYQCCIIDPEGDYGAYAQAAVLGDPSHEPTVDEIIALLTNPSQHVVVNLLGIALERRPSFFAHLLPRLQDLRRRTGRPHWIVVDEAHHMLHTDRAASSILLPQQPWGMLYITVHPDLMAPAVLSTIDHVAIIGESPNATLQAFCHAVGETPPQDSPSSLRQGEVLFWQRGAGNQPMRLRSAQPTSEHQRHIRKYAEGDMQDNSFYFRGPQGKLNLRVQNLMMFLQIADGVDDDTWQYHLVKGDYARWFKDAVKDNALAQEAAHIAADTALDAYESRARIRAAIERRYTAPAV